MSSSPPSEPGPAEGRKAPDSAAQPRSPGLPEGLAEGLVIVTVCMNRLEHLLHSAAKVSRWPFHQQHLIVDWSSAVPLRRGQLPPDPRIRLLRVEAEPGWKIGRAHV